VAECAVVGHKDPRWGEKVVAFVVPSEGTTLDIKVLKEHCKQTMAQYKVPREFQIVDKLPTSFLGKLRRTELRALASSNEGESTAAAS
jgi:fatty-acyl-CoA synthase